MGVFGEFFGFDGRINRLGFLWRGIAAAFCITLLTAMSLAALVFFLHPGSFNIDDTWTQRLIVGVALLWLWISVALASRRLRDMGLEPAYIVPLYAALWVVDTVLLAPLSMMDPQSFGSLQTGWSVLHWLMLVPLLFWPSRARPEPVSRVYEPAQPTAYLNWRDGG